MKSHANKSTPKRHQANGHVPASAEKKHPAWLTLPLNATIAAAALAFTVGTAVLVVSDQRHAEELCTGKEMMLAPLDVPDEPPLAEPDVLDPALLPETQTEEDDN